LDKVLTRSEVDLGALAPFTVDDGVSLQWSGSIFPDEEPTFLYGDIEVYYSTYLLFFSLFFFLPRVPLDYIY